MVEESEMKAYFADIWLQLHEHQVTELNLLFLPRNG